MTASFLQSCVRFWRARRAENKPQVSCGGGLLHSAGGRGFHRPGLDRVLIMSHSFHSADRRTHARVIFAAVLCSTVVLFCLAVGCSTRGSTTQVVKAKATVVVGDSAAS